MVSCALRELAVRKLGGMILGDVARGLEVDGAQFSGDAPPVAYMPRAGQRYVKNPS